jgi:lipoate-protein ligase A
MTTPRPPVEVLLGSAPEAAREIALDFEMLERAAEGPAVRAWTGRTTAVVLGVSRDVAEEVDVGECERRGVAILRRASGGGTVVITEGTVQYAFLLPHDEATTIGEVKAACNAIVKRALGEAGIAAALETDPSGDLRAGDRKVGGLALRRRRHATMLHGTLLVEADLKGIAALLRHPAREPAWRQGRPHLEFLANLGPLAFESFLRSLHDGLPREVASRGR